ncbi:MAG: esterase-like activity of phytase family protein [Thermoleophilia bacterium]|nr:esterase-like activity of phytase family protein [Thermoleophilia bacterium]
MRRRHGSAKRRALGAAGALTIAVVGAVAAAQGAPAPEPAPGASTLEGRAILPATTFRPGPTSGAHIGAGPFNGIAPPFPGAQPVQGFSAVLRNRDGSYDVMSDNGYGSLENSADFVLAVHRIRPSFATARGGAGTIAVTRRTVLSDPRNHIDFTIVNEFTKTRVLTGADFDIESMQRAADGTLWFGDEFGPVLLHTDARGRVLEPPVRLPDPADPSKELRSPQSPYSEESSSVRLMNAVTAHAHANGATRTPVFSPWEVMLADGIPETGIPSRDAPPAGSGVAAASNEIHDVAKMKAAGYSVVPYTVNTTERMVQLMKLGVNGLISDRPDLLRAAVAGFDADADGTPGDYLGADGLIDPAKFDAQGHRGGRNLRPENTLPAMEVALDNLMTTLETDTGVTKDGVTVHDHDPYIESAKCRRADGSAYGPDDQVLVKDLTAAEIQSQFICDKVFRGPEQLNDPSLSPVTVAFAAQEGLPSPYVMPTTQQLFDFTTFYERWYTDGPGASAPDAALRRANAARVRFNIETKTNPRTDLDEHGIAYDARTLGPDEFVAALAGVIEDNDLEQRADIQSFDWRTLIGVQEEHPAIRTVYLFGDFAKFADPTITDSDDGTNLQPQGGDTSPWLAGLVWPYRDTAVSTPFRAKQSGGLEGMALTRDRRYLRPLLELPLVGDDPKTLQILEYDLKRHRFTARHDTYTLEQRGTNIGDFVMFSATKGLVIERDPTQGDLAGFKSIYEVTFAPGGGPAEKRLAADLMAIDDPAGISSRGAADGDVGLGSRFAFPFTTIEDVVVLGPDRIGVLNDNNFPFSLGRHLGTKAPDDNEFIVLRLATPLG